MNRVKAVNPSAMTEKEAEHLALERVPGTVKKQTRQSRVATYTIQKEDGKTYEVKVDMQAKTVLSADQISSKDQQKRRLRKKKPKQLQSEKRAVQRMTQISKKVRALSSLKWTLIFLMIRKRQ